MKKKEYKRVTLEIEEDMVEWLDEKAKEEDRSRSAIIRRILKEKKEEDKK